MTENGDSGLLRETFFDPSSLDHMPNGLGLNYYNKYYRHDTGTCNYSLNMKNYKEFCSLPGPADMVPKIQRIFINKASA